MLNMSSLNEALDDSIEDVPFIPLLREHAKFVDSSIDKLESTINNPSSVLKYSKVDNAKILVANQMKAIMKLKEEVLEMKRTLTLEIGDFRTLCMEAQEMEETLRKDLMSIQEQLMGFGYQPPAQTPLKSQNGLQMSVMSDCAREEVLEVTPGLYVAAGRCKPGARSSEDDGDVASGGDRAPGGRYLDGVSEAAPQQTRSRSKKLERDSDGVLIEPKLSKYFYETIGQDPPPSI